MARRLKVPLWPKTKKIDGKTYKLDGSTYTKAEAKALARRLRERRLLGGRGYSARVISSDKPKRPWPGWSANKYAVYFRIVKKARR